MLLRALLPLTINGGLLPRESIRAPIIPRGSITLCIGRELKELSPVNVAVKSCVASNPARSLIVEPLLPQSKGSNGARNPCPSMPLNIRSFPFLSNETPSCPRHDNVDAQSLPVEKFVM